MVNKKGVETLGVIFVIFAALFILIILAICSYSFGLLDNTLSGLDLTVGNTTWNETYTAQLQPAIQTIETTIPQNVSIGVILGMVLCLLLVGSKVPAKSNLWIILDIFILIIAEIVAVAVSSTFRESLLHITPEFFTIFSTTLSATSKFILNLPTLTATIGVLVILATYIMRKEQKEEEMEVSLYQ